MGVHRTLYLPANRAESGSEITDKVRYTITVPPFCKTSLSIFSCVFLCPMDFRNPYKLSGHTIGLHVYFYFEILPQEYLVIVCRTLWTYLFAICGAAEFKVRSHSLDCKSLILSPFTFQCPVLIKGFLEVLFCPLFFVVDIRLDHALPEGYEHDARRPTKTRFK